MRAALRRPALRNFLFNVFGNAIPMVAAIVALPIIAREAGAARLGFLGLTWALIGYFGLLDLGLSRVVTRQVAIAEGSRGLAGQRALVMGLCQRLFLVVGILALGLAWGVPAQWVAGRGASPDFVLEARPALVMLWLTLPATVVTGLLRGALEGRQHFGTVNLLRIVFGVWSFAAPLALLPWSNRLPALTLAVATGRFLSLLAHYLAARTALGAHDAADALPPQIWPYIREGGWLTVSNVVGPLMVTFDRFAVAGLVSLSAAAFYFVPQEIALRMLIIPGALAATIFPMIARLDQTAGARAQARISHSALLAAVIVSLPTCIVLAGLAEPLLAVWMGAAFAAQSAPVAAILAIGLFANCAAQVPASWIQAAGRADVTGRLHLAELPVYALVLAALTWRFGILGAAWAWTLRASTDCALLLYASQRLFPSREESAGIRALALGMLLVAAFAAGATWLEGESYWIVFSAGILLALGFFRNWSRRLRTLVEG
jgi:O-antigen/teichoic acid export membrane protein